MASYVMQDQGADLLRGLWRRLRGSAAWLQAFQQHLQGDQRFICRAGCQARAGQGSLHHAPVLIGQAPLQGVRGKGRVLALPCQLAELLQCLHRHMKIGTDFLKQLQSPDGHHRTSARGKEGARGASGLHWSTMTAMHRCACEELTERRRVAEGASRACARLTAVPGTRPAALLARAPCTNWAAACHAALASAHHKAPITSCQPVRVRAAVHARNEEPSWGPLLARHEADAQVPGPAAGRQGPGLKPCLRCSRRTGIACCCVCG